jgi:glycosyltransferase involved in cell wall biosynthesis
VAEVPNRLVFTATMNYGPNAEAAIHFATHIWPQVRAAIPDATLKIVGHGPPAPVRQLGQRPGITVTGSVPDVRPYLASAQAVVVPLRIGGGTRLKIVEALAMAKPVVTTTLGAEGLAVEPGRHLLIADDPDAFASDVIALLRDPARRASLAHAGRALVEERYDWGAIGAQLDDALHHLLPER